MGIWKSSISIFLNFIIKTALKTSTNVSDNDLNHEDQTFPANLLIIDRVDQ